MISSKVTAVLRRRWPILVISLVIGSLAGVLSSQLAPATSFSNTGLNRWWWPTPLAPVAYRYNRTV